MPGVESNQTSSPLWHQPAELHWPNPRWEGSSWVETHNVARIRCRLTNGGNEVYKTVGEFAEITVNIYFRHSSVHGKVEMLFPPSISFYPQGLILDKDSEFLNHSSYTPCLNLQLNVLLPKWALDPKKQLTLKMKKKNELETKTWKPIFLVKWILLRHFLVSSLCILLGCSDCEDYKIKIKWLCNIWLVSFSTWHFFLLQH